jgi:two-component system, chemotaxis family, CheB/CheR fusion protein
VTAEPGFDAVLHHLREARGVDFTGYKPASLERRLRRRMQSLRVASFEDYLDHLQVHPEEFGQLFDSVLINVTKFHRDPEAWAYLAEVIIPELLSRKPTGPLRLWSAGCASGQEPYSLAMVMAEALGLDELRERVKIYATDVDEHALAHARSATYAERDLDGLPPELADRYLEPQAADGSRSFRREIRRAVIFGRNDLVQDAPISHVDLLACRNTLMYFTAETQARVLNRLHFALDPGGVLFLGRAEMLLSHTTLFAPVEVRRRFFRKVRDAHDRAAPVTAPSLRPPSPRALDALTAVQTQALLSSPVAQVVLDAAGTLVLSNHRAELLLGLASRDAGQPFAELPIAYRPVDLRPLVDGVLRGRRPAWLRGAESLRPDGEPLAFDVQAVPLLAPDGTLLGAAVTFHDVTQQRQLQGELEHANRQLGVAYEELQSTNEELETTNEELQSTVEELETTNEELQSTNEELETLNEELQSMNDELQAGNEELRERTEEIAGLNTFLDAVLSSLGAGVAVVDPSLRVTAWNRRAEDLWGLRPEEAVGNHLLDLDIGLPLEGLAAMLKDGAQGDDHPGTGAPPGLEVAAVNRRGREVLVRVTVSPLFHRAGDHAGAIVVMDEVT